MPAGRFRILNYSLLRLFTGFASAALMAWKLTVSNVTNKVAATASAKIHQVSVVRYSYWFNQLVRKYQASGIAMKQAISTM